MRSKLAEVFLAAALAGQMIGCAGAPRPAPPDLALDDALKRLAFRAPQILNARGRLGVRAPDGDSNLAFRLAYDERLGMRIDFTWKALIGLVRRDGVLLVRGDSAWGWASREEDGRGVEDFPLLEGPLSRDFAPADFVELLIGTVGDLERRRAEIASYERLERGSAYRLALRRPGRVESFVFDSASGRLLQRSLTDGTSGRRVVAVYERHGSGGGAPTRPGAIDLRDSFGPVRMRFVISEQDTTRREDRRAFDVPPGARRIHPVSPDQDRIVLPGELSHP